MIIIPKLRQAIARLLAPDAFRDSHRYRYLLATIEQDRQWLSEFPEIRAALDRIYIGHFDHYRAIGTEPRCQHPSDISRFREQLRRNQERIPEHGKQD